MNKEIEIPEGYEARIEGNKVILEPKESEDEKIRKQLIGFLSGRYALCNINTKDAIAYLERQKEQKPESCDCSRDEESYMNGIHHVLMNPEAYGLIKQKPAEWSEEDKLHLNNAILVAKKEWGVNSYTARFLESLRDNCKKCNNHWKPSKEQMKALEKAWLECDNKETSVVLNSLMLDLQKIL